MIGLEHHPSPEEQRTQLSSLKLPLGSEDMAVGRLSVTRGISTLVSGSGQVPLFLLGGTLRGQCDISRPRWSLPGESGYPSLLPQSLYH